MFSITASIGDPAGSRFIEIDLVVDIRSSYTSLPASFLLSLGVEPKERRLFVDSKGSRELVGVAQTWMRIGDKQEMAVVVFAEEDKRPVLGSVTLNEFCLAVGPSGKELVRVPAYRISSRVVS